MEQFSNIELPVSQQVQGFLPPGRGGEQVTGLVEVQGAVGEAGGGGAGGGVLINTNSKTMYNYVIV